MATFLYPPNSNKAFQASYPAPISGSGTVLKLNWAFCANSFFLKPTMKIWPLKVTIQVQGLNKSITSERMKKVT